MTPERYKEVGQLCRAALELESAQRAAYLAKACGDDEALRQEVESLLGYEVGDTRLLDQPALEVVARALAEEQAGSPIGQRVGHCRILSLLGKGGMGEVWLAEDTQLSRKVAVKLLPAEFTSDVERVRRFAQEARAASALNHPNIITIHEIGEVQIEAGATHYITTEYVEGETLRQHLSDAQPQRMKLLEALETAIQIAAALNAAHEAGIVHRDIKPENVMVRHDGIVKVLDFGLAKLTELSAPSVGMQAQSLTRNSTEAGMVLGTPRYMSPEQARGEKVDRRSDLFSLGVVLYEMAGARAPFEGINAVDVMGAILNREPVPLKQHAPDAPDELQRIIGKALRKEREERYQTAQDLLLDLKALKQDLEIGARLGQPIRAGSSGERMTGGSDEQATALTAGNSATPTLEESPAQTTSSAEYLVSEIKRHKLSVLITLLILFAAVAGIGFYLHVRNTELAIDSIAVLPFANQNRDSETDYLADGLTEGIINNLTQLADLRVIARSSAFRYKGKEDDPLNAGKTLGVRAVVTGRLLLRGENLIISAELVDVRDNKQLWGDHYNRKLADVFAVQEEIAKEISEKLRLKLSGAERQQLAKRPTENLKAFQYYMQGRAYAQRRTREDLLEAIRYYEKAIEEDRNYALAYAGLADAYTILGARGQIAPIEGRRKAEEAARKALALDDNLAEAHAALGLTYTWFAPSDFSLGDPELRRAIELSPSLAIAHQYVGISLVQRGRLDEGLAEMLKARERDPLSSIIARLVALPYYLKRDNARALELLRQANELGPAFSIHWEEGVYIQNRLFNEAFAELEKAKRERKNDPVLIYSTGMVYAARGERAEALQLIKELEVMSGANLSQAHWIAKIYAALNEKELALTWLERGLAAGAIGIFYKDEPVWDMLRSDARFGDLLRRMGVPQ